VHSSLGEQDGHHPRFRCRGRSLTFTVGQITWTIRTDGLMSMTLEENQIRSEVAKVLILITSNSTTFAPTTLLATSITCPPLPCYNGKQVDNSNLLEAIDCTNHRLSKVSDLVNSISDQTAQAMAPGFFDFPRPTHAIMHERLGTSLTITSTLEG